MSYEPKGKVAMLVAAVRARPEQTVWTSSDLAQVAEIMPKQIPAYLDSAIRHGLLYRTLENGKCLYSLQPFSIPWKPPVMTPPRGDTGNVPRAPLPAPISVRPAREPLPPMPAPEPDLLPEVEEVEEAVAFTAALFLDGDLAIYGAQENEDGSFTLTRDQLAKLLPLVTAGAALA